MANLLDIITNPNPILRKRSAEITPDMMKGDDFSALCEDMKRTMQERDGIGLAAPQIGRNIRLIAIATKDGPLCLINPVLRDPSWRKEWGEEGCLSVPNIFGDVQRHKKTACDYLAVNGEKKTMDAEGLMARVLQHEIDHLDGILFIDKARDLKQIK